MIEYRIRLDEELDAALIARIDQKANGGSRNKALIFLVRHWFENEQMAILPQKWPESGDICGTSVAELDDPIAEAIEAIDDLW